jgi:hypothetical protein
MRLFAITMAAALAGCVSVVPGHIKFEGQLQDSHDRITGKATAYVDSSGPVALDVGHGVMCTGGFVKTTPREGRATLDCTDGRAGSFDFAWSGQRGVATGTLGGEKFNLSIERE